MEATSKHVTPAAVLGPTLSSATARSIARFRSPAWILAVRPHEATCQQLQFRYGVFPEQAAQPPASWNAYARQWVREHELESKLLVLTKRPSSKNPHASHRMGIIDLSHE